MSEPNGSLGGLLPMADASICWQNLVSRGQLERRGSLCQPRNLARREVVG